MPKLPSSQMSSGILNKIWKDKYFYLALCTIVSFLYLFGLRDHMYISRCHSYAEKMARNKLIERVKADPANKTLIQAAQANLYANEDYQPSYADCMIKNGYR